MVEGGGLPRFVLNSVRMSQSPTGNGSFEQRLMKGLLIKHEWSTEKPLNIEPWATNAGAPLPAFRLEGVRKRR